MKKRWMIVIVCALMVIGQVFAPLESKLTLLKRIAESVEMD